MKLRKISILVPVFNEESVIGNTLDHLLNEVEYPRKEIIVGLDGCTDNSYNIVKTL